jgi:hypothetical protein
MKSLVTALVLVAAVAAPALAGQCPLLQAQIDKAVGKPLRSGRSQCPSDRGAGRLAAQIG